MDLLAPDVHRIAPEGNAAANDRVPDELASGTPEPLRRELIGLLGADRVLNRVIDLVRYASDASPYRLLPRAVVMARDMVVLLQKVRKVDKAVPVTKGKWHMKAVRCLFSVVFLNADLLIHTVLNIKY